MSIQQMLLGASGASGYNIDKSLRFRRSASAWLSRTPASTTNRRTFTYSAWVKRGQLSVGQIVFNSGAYVTFGQFTSVGFDAADTMSVVSGLWASSTDFNLTTASVFRDPSAWYHIVLQVDTTQATAANRIRLYVNNVLQTFATGSQPAQNYDTAINASGIVHGIGAPNGSGSILDGYMADAYFVDGQALTPASFGETNALTGVWQPKAYTGTYGTNGFYLDFETTTSVAALGTDKSGNGNTWTVNNVSLTAGVTYDSMTDVPTLTSATTSNFPVLNRILPAAGLPDIRDANLYLRCADASNFTAIPATMLLPKTGKWYAEFTAIYVDGTTSILDVGLLDSTDFPTPSGVIGASSKSYGYRNTGSKLNNGAATAYGASYVIGDIIAIAFDATAGTLTFYKNNVSQGVAFTGLTAEYFFAIGGYNFAQWQANFGQRPFSYTPPTGFVALNTFNLPTASILKGNTVMDATLYTGNGSTQTITNAGGFQPDLVWIKNRNNVRYHILTDSVRGTNSQLFSNDTLAQEARTDRLTAFNSTGFNVGSYIDVNGNADTFVAWQWQAGQGTTSSNTNGSITSTVSVNPTAGFSVVTYTGTGANATVGHGLGVAPKMIIAKSRQYAQSWLVYHQSITANNYLILNDTAASQASITAWNNTAPTSSVFSIGNSNTVNFPSGTQLAYCWSEIDGYSKFGSYTGNGSTNGTFVYLGFQPKFIMIKSSSAAYAWFMEDIQRNLYNGNSAILQANSDAAEITGTSYNVDFLSNGFKLTTAQANINASGSTFVYMAFSSNPFKNSLAR
jgi:hypothetical protein